MQIICVILNKLHIFTDYFQFYYYLIVNGETLLRMIDIFCYKLYTNEAAK